MRAASAPFESKKRTAPSATTDVPDFQACSRAIHQTNFLPRKVVESEVIPIGLAVAIVLVRLATDRTTEVIGREIFHASNAAALKGSGDRDRCCQEKHRKWTVKASSLCQISS